MTIQVLLFAAAREQVGASTITLELPAEATTADAKQTLVDEYPRLAIIVASSRLAAGGEFVADDAVVEEGIELAVIPPVSGG